MLETKDVPDGPGPGSQGKETRLVSAWLHRQGSGRLLVCLVLTLVTLACYRPITRHSFISIDDHEYITENLRVVQGLTWANVGWAFSSTEACNWHPLTWLSHMLDCEVYGLNPGGHHLTNLLVHILNALLLFVLLNQMTGAPGRSALVAALFAWHPMHVESVAWASERKDVLSTFFFLLTLLAYARYADNWGSPQATEQSPETLGQPSPSPSRGELGESPTESGWKTQNSKIPKPRSFSYWLALLFFALGLMSKPMLVTLPFVLLLLDYWPLNRLSLPLLEQSPPATISLTSAVLEKLPFFALTMAASIVTYTVQKTGGAVSSLTILPLHSRMANALVAYTRYVGKSIWPSKLAAIYPYPDHWPALWVVGAAAALVGVTVFCFRCSRRYPYLLVGWLWFLGTLVPTIGLVQVGSQSMADRYIYIPGIGLYIVAVWGINEFMRGLPGRRLILSATAAGALVACLVSSRVQLTYWKDSESLLRHALVVTAGNYIAYDGLGTVLSELGREPEALAMCVESVRLKPEYAQGQYDLGTILLKQGKLDEAIEHLNRALQLQPSFAQAEGNLGKVLVQQGKLDEAEAHLTRAAALLPANSQIQYNLGTVLLQRGKVEEAIRHFSIAVRLKPDYAEAHSNLGVALMRSGRATEGTAHLSEALRLNPSDAGVAVNLGVALLELKRPAEATAPLSNAVRLNPDAPRPHYFLALALVSQHEPKEALAHARKARELAWALGQEELATKAESLIKLCESGDPVPP